MRDSAARFEAVQAPAEMITNPMDPPSPRLLDRFEAELRCYASCVFTRDMLLELYHHMEWADAKAWEAAPDNGPPDDRLRLLLVHIHVVQRAFLHVWTHQPVVEAFRTPEDFSTLAGVRAWARPYYPEARRFLDGVTADQLSQPLTMPWAAELSKHLGRPPHATTLGETCFQVASHSTYHRGQVNTRFRELGAEPPLVDYIAWVWFGRPAAWWGPI